MTKSELIEVVYAKSGFTKKDATAAVNATIEAIVDALVAGEKVSISGLGVFSVKTRAARTGLNPMTQEKIEIKATKSPSFSASKTLKDAVNK